MSKSRTGFLKVLALPLLGLGALAVLAAAPEAPKVFVNVGTVGLTKNLVKHRYTGRVLSPAKVDVVARVSGELLEVGFEEGTFVKEGQVLYRLDDVPYVAAVKSAEAAVEECKAKANYAQQTYDRAHDLYSKQVTSKDSFDSAISDLSYAKAALMGAEAALVKARDNLDDTVIVTPISGKIGTTRYTKGNYLTPSSGILATVVQQDPLRVRFSISNKDFLTDFGSEQALKEKGEVEIRLGDGTVYSEKGKIIIVENEANESTDTIVLYALFNNPDYKLTPGTTVVATLQYLAPGDTPWIPPSAVMHDGTSAYVFVLDENNVANRRNIVEGSQTGEKQLVLSGLAAGERVVTDGMLKVTPGAPVVPVEEGGSSAK